jgi:hypothetical protein
VKKIVFSILCILLYSCSSSDSDSNSEEEQNVPAGFLKQITSSGTYGSEIYRYYYNGTKISKISKTSMFSSTKKFIYTGDLITEINEYDSNSEITSKYIFQYNSLNKLKSSVFLNYFQSEVIKNVINYNSNGTISVSTYRGNSTSQTLFEFSTIHYFSNNNIGSSEMTYNNTLINFAYEYDSSSNPLSQITGYNNLIDVGIGFNLIPYLRNGVNNCLKVSVSGGNFDCPIIAYKAVYNSVYILPFSRIKERLSSTIFINIFT